MYTNIFIGTLIVIWKDWKQLKCPSVEDRKVDYCISISVTVCSREKNETAEYTDVEQTLSTYC